MADAGIEMPCPVESEDETYRSLNADRVSTAACLASVEESKRAYILSTLNTGADLYQISRTRFQWRSWHSSKSPRA